MTLFIAFMVGMGFYMLYSTQEKPESDYYEKDLGYEKTWVAQKNATDLAQKPLITYQVATNSLKIEFPFDLTTSNGTVHVLKASDQQQDKKFILTKESTQEFALPTTAKGHYQVILYWVQEGKEFEIRQKIRIN